MKKFVKIFKIIIVICFVGLIFILRDIFIFFKTEIEIKKENKRNGIIND